MSNHGGFGSQPGERESTQHGVVNDITVPRLRWQSIVLLDELMIGAALLLVPIGATLLDVWVFPVFAFFVTAYLFRHTLDGVTDSTDAGYKLGLAAFVCLLVFGAGVGLRNPISNRLLDAWDNLWQWPPQVGYFLSKCAFLVIPFFIPIFTRTPLLTEFFKITLKDPTWPSPRTAQDIEGVQSPDAYRVDEVEPPPSTTYKITTWFKDRLHGKLPTAKIDNWFAPKRKGCENGLADFCKAILEDRATFSEKGGRKTSRNRKLGAVDFGYTQDEYALLRQIGIDLALLETKGAKNEPTDGGIDTMLSIVVQTLGIDAVPEKYQHLV